MRGRRRGQPHLTTRRCQAPFGDGLTHPQSMLDNLRMSRDHPSLSVPPILASKEFAAPSVFAPANLLREARRQKGLIEANIPEICVLDPDGDILRTLRREQRASLSPAWACYHTDL